MGQTNDWQPSETFEEDYNFMPQSWTLKYLKDSAIHMKLTRPRSLAWAIMLMALPEPEHDVTKHLKQHRKVYCELKLKFTMDPRTVLGDDPLSQKDESVWNQYFCDNELKALILQDVVRTFPDEPYFRDSGVQDLMVRVLFVWARSHSNVGYRQGMHEILAPLLLELYLDRKLAPDTSSDILNEYLKEEYLESDSYMLFSTIMKGLEKFYTTGDVVPTSCGRLPTIKMQHNPNEVIRYLEKVKEEHLVPSDPVLAAHLSECNISLELFGIRWLRLLFGREFPRTEIPHLWSYLFSDGPMLPNLHCVIVAMLISMRGTLLNPDPGVMLSALMRPANLSVGHVVAFSLHLNQPLIHPRPPTPPPQPPLYIKTNKQRLEEWSIEERGVPGGGGAEGEGVAEGADVARELATLALLRAQLPANAAALAAAIPRPPPHIARPLHQILQLSSLLQCRNHALVDVETALEAAEGQPPDRYGKRQLVPVIMVSGKQAGGHVTPGRGVKRQLKEVPLKLFHQCECDSSVSDLPSLDPLRLRTE